MTSDMLVLKAKTDDILRDCLKMDPNFKDAAREGFEHFIIQRANKPAEMIAKFADSKLKSGNEETLEKKLEILMDRLLVFFWYRHGKDVFEEFYKKDLARRLLLDLSASVGSEKLKSEMQQKLKARMRSRLEGMFRDVEVSKEQASGFFLYVTRLAQTTTLTSLDFSINVLTQGIWPNYTPTEITLPVEMTVFMKAFQDYYIGSHNINGRKLQWLFTLGRRRVAQPRTRRRRTSSSALSFKRWCGCCLIRMAKWRILKFSRRP